MQDDWNAPEYMNWEHEKPRNGPFVGLAKVSIDFMNLETCRRSWKHIHLHISPSFFERAK